MPVFIYKTKWFMRGRVIQLLYAMERGGAEERKWSWNYYRRLITFSGENAEASCSRLNAVYPAAAITKV